MDAMLTNVLNLNRAILLTEALRLLFRKFPERVHV